MLSEYSGSIDDQTPNVSRPQTTMSKIPSDRLSPEDLESRPESRLPSITTHATAPTPTLVDAGMNTPSPCEELSSVDSSRHRVLDMFTPRASTSNDQKVVESVSDNVKQEVFEESPRGSYKLSTPQPSLRSISSADLPLSEIEFLARPPSSVSVKSGVPLANELGVSRPQSATPLSVMEDARDGASSGTLSKSSPRIKFTGRELLSPALSPAEGPESRSELPSARSHAADDLVTTEHASADLAITDKVSAKNETPRSADDFTTKGQTSAASQLDVKSPHSSESSQSAADAPVAEKDDERSKVGSPAVSSLELQSNADNAVEQQPTIVADAGDPSLAPATSTVDECTLLMAEEYDINESSLSDDDDDEDNDSACERILQLSLSP
ncbi:unnamed protein product [Dibothriocephalus latus]|uniref:Uncharacterized protein n=1 Tax=Dibothriocephalus latus TaxID=60516 RepID=A0A3P7MI90_DIBLA|nr:unnamed protein product [Dibothriocephalus latus]